MGQGVGGVPEWERPQWCFSFFSLQALEMLCQIWFIHTHFEHTCGLLLPVKLDDTFVVTVLVEPTKQRDL